MGLSGKTGFALGAGLLALLGVVAALSLTLVRDGFRPLERMHGERNAALLREAIAEAHAQLDVKAADWAGWDDTYGFIVDGNAAYRNSNLTRESIDLLGLAMMAFVDLDGRLVVTRGTDPATGEYGDGWAALRDAITSTPALCTPPTEAASRHGLVMVEGKPLLVAVRAILTSQQEGPARGTLVFVREVDEPMRRRLEELLQGRVRMGAPADIDMEAPGYRVVDSANGTRLLIGDTDLHAMTTVEDLSGRPVLTAALTMPREIAARGWAGVRFSLLVVFVTGIVLWVATDRLMKVLVISRVKRLSEELAGIEASGTAALRVTGDDRDEIGALSRGVNRMLAALDARAAELREARAAAEAASRVKGEFVAAISHEVRSPLAAVVGSVELLRGEALSESQKRENVETIARNARHLLVVVSDLLDHSKIEAGRMTLEAIEFSPRLVVRESVDMMAGMARAKGLDLRVDLSARVVRTLSGDPTRVRQIMLNLVGNAVKFTSTGGVIVRAGMGPSDGGVAHLRLEVEDTGIGMSREQVAGLFRAYEQCDASTARLYGGTGLGLAISRALARQMGGDITVRSRLGVGSVFTLELPAGAVGDVRMVGEGEDVPADAGDRVCSLPILATITPSVGRSAADGARRLDMKPLDGLRVLLADDSEDNRRLLAHHLERAGAGVTCVEDGRQAVEAAELDAGFDVVILDLRMPVMDGWEAAGRLRSRGYAGRLLAASASTTDTPEALAAAGFAESLTKPVGPADLVAAVKRLAGGARRRAA